MDFKNQKLEILNNERWLEVSESVFVSWTGKRRLNGQKYLGPRYYYLTNQLISDNQKTED